MVSHIRSGTRLQRCESALKRDFSRECSNGAPGLKEHLSPGRLERKTGFEPATLTLAR